MERHELSPLIEALLFATDQPLTVNALVKAVDDEQVTRADVKAALEALRENFDIHPRGFELVRLGNGWQILTRARYAPWIDNLLKVRRRARLSRAALETAAVIAYKQPISRVEVERIRGVDSGAVVSTLLERELVMIKGRDPGPGRPLLYGTTQKFLEYFGLSSVGDLPRLDELAQLAGLDREGWSDTERERFEKHGIDVESLQAAEGLRADGPEGDAVEGDDEDAAPDASDLVAEPGDEAAAPDEEVDFADEEASFADAPDDDPERDRIDASLEG